MLLRIFQIWENTPTYLPFVLFVITIIGLTCGVVELQWLKAVLTQPGLTRHYPVQTQLLEFAALAAFRTWGTGLMLKLLFDFNRTILLATSRFWSGVMMGLYLLAGIASGVYVTLECRITIFQGVLYILALAIGTLLATGLVFYDSKRLKSLRLTLVSISVGLHILVISNINHKIFLPMSWVSYYLMISLAWILLSLILIALRADSHGNPRRNL